LLGLYRFRVALRYLGKTIKELAIWLVRSRETTNFTYDLEESNKRHLAAFVAQVTGVPYRDIQQYIAEIENDGELRRHIREAARPGEDNVTDSDVKYGRRLGWYALVRAKKPGVVVETGVDKGLGSCVLTAALARNSREGHEGYYYGTDINPRAGHLLRDNYARFGSILFGDSIESLRELEGYVDVFVNDSDHSADYEAREYEAIRDKLGTGAIVLGDNSHATDRLLEFAERTGRHFLFFQEKPQGHWYPGAGIGAAFERE
jgi:predicted O-methyltransferase YrrM